ncbi:enoyl-CoA hydratase [Syntrophus gentianae]|uniref:Enoyl-CoA hydratase n=1 Tax=Syntrophus gentianae TaxID=43775 RepID=A0A1H7XL35_9BACT|nr:enoyl-CoA hydratase/isomerase family protein [Syntrophus gentianae]SEM34363.1 enoyl-CoA hydratase [Syntrophus gentianae]
MPYQTIIVEKMDGSAIITLNRPREMNAVSLGMRRELMDAFTVLEKDRSVNTMILTGGGFVFSAGTDIREMAELDDDEVADYLTSIKQCLTALYTFKKPVIAAVGGIAMGEGLNLITVCDIVIASESAIFSHPEIKLFGVNPLFHVLRDIVGTNKAKEMTMLAEPVGAMEAFRIGLANKVATLENFMGEAIAMAKELSNRSPEVLQALKRICNLTSSMDKLSSLDLEYDACEYFLSKKERKDYMEKFRGEVKKRKGT